MPISLVDEDYEDFKDLVKNSWGEINSLEYWEKLLSE
jgi:hypothetical protein